MRQISLALEGKVRAIRFINYEISLCFIPDFQDNSGLLQSVTIPSPTDINTTRFTLALPLTLTLVLLIEYLHQLLKVSTSRRLIPGWLGTPYRAYMLTLKAVSACTFAGRPSGVLSATYIQNAAETSSGIAAAVETNLATAATKIDISDGTS
jgi:hypothetical protein